MHFAESTFFKLLYRYDEVADMSLNYLVNKEQKAHEADIFSIVYQKDAIFTTSTDGSVKEWSTITQELTSTIDKAYTLGGHQLTASEDIVLGVGFAGDLIALPDKVIPTTTIPWSIAVSPDSTTLATTTSTGTLQVYDLASSSVVAEIPTRGLFGMQVAYAPNNRLIASCHKSGGLYLFDAELGSLSLSLIGHAETIRCCEFSPASEVLASAGANVLLHDTKSGELITTLKHASVTSLSWNATGEMLLTASMDGKLKIWMIETRECVGTFTESVGHRIWSVKWIRMGPQRQEGFVVGGSQGVLKFYLPTSQG